MVRPTHTHTQVKAKFFSRLKAFFRRIFLHFFILFVAQEVEEKAYPSLTYQIGCPHAPRHNLFHVNLQASCITIV